MTRNGQQHGVTHSNKGDIMKTITIASCKANEIKDLLKAYKEYTILDSWLEGEKVFFTLSK